MAEIKLKPCPFCGEPAELDTRRSYRNITTGHLGDAIAIYCMRCVCDLSVCKADVPDIEPEQVAEMWNARAFPAPVDDLAMLVRQLAYSLRRAAPEHTLPDRAVALLRKHGLQGTVLREEIPSPAGRTQC